MVGPRSSRSAVKGGLKRVRSAVSRGVSRLVRVRRRVRPSAVRGLFARSDVSPARTVSRSRRAVRAFESNSELHALREQLSSHSSSTVQGIPFSQIKEHGAHFMGAFSEFEVPAGRRTFIVKLDGSSYESPVEVSILEKSPVHYRLSDPVAHVRLAFDRNRILVEAVQGVDGRKTALNAFYRAVGEPWPNYLIKKIMALGRRLGYSKIGLRRPQSLHWYKRPVGVGTFDFGDRFRVRRLMRRFYSNVRKGLGFRLREGDYWVKSL